ncbi:hypothetical protein TNCV_2133341 [Trichonephila clavipes]|nr:hypothetical protein TNCV_2133341 [Trichonephila clavipes]
MGVGAVSGSGIFIKKESRVRTYRYPGQTMYQFNEWYEGNRLGAALLGTSSRRDETTLVRFLAVDNLVLNDMWWVLKFTLLVRTAM